MQSTRLFLLLSWLILAGDIASAQVQATAPRVTTNPSGNKDQSAPAADDNHCSRADQLTNKCWPYNRPREHRRPIIIVPPPAAPPIDDTPLSSDWEGCKKTKLDQLRLSQNGNLERAKQLDEWLWKNCRSYSQDLRQLEQDQM